MFIQPNFFLNQTNFTLTPIHKQLIVNIHVSKPNTWPNYTYTDIIVVCVLQAKVIFLYNIKVIKTFLQQNTAFIMFLKKKRIHKLSSTKTITRMFSFQGTKVRNTLCNKMKQDILFIISYLHVFCKQKFFGKVLHFTFVIS